MQECKRCGQACKFIPLYSVYKCEYCGTLSQPDYNGSISDVITELRRCSVTDWNGKMGNECLAPKNLLIRAADLLDSLRE